MKLVGLVVVEIVKVNGCWDIVYGGVSIIEVFDDFVAVLVVDLVVFVIFDWFTSINWFVILYWL